MAGMMDTKDSSRKNAIDCYHAMFREYEQLEQINREAEQWIAFAKARAQYRKPRQPDELIEYVMGRGWVLT